VSLPPLGDPDGSAGLRLGGRRSRIRRVRPLIEIEVEYHGRPGGASPDPVLRAVTVVDGTLTTAS
jgi:hypothetical protein